MDSAARRIGLGLGLLLTAAAGTAMAQDPSQPADAKPRQDGAGILGVLRPGAGGPDPFTLLPDTGVDPLTVVQTRPIELTGFDGPLILSVEDGIDVIIVHNDRAFRKRRTLVMPGDVIVLSARSPLAFGTTEEVRLTIGSYSTPWVISTRGQDRTPRVFAIPPANPQSPDALALSEKRLLHGFEGPVGASIAGPGNPHLRVNGGPWQTTADVNPGDLIQLSAASPAAGDRIRLTLTVGDLEVPWEVTTVPATKAEAPKTD